MEGKKKLVKANDVGNVNVPRFGEFKVAALYDVIKDNEEIEKYLSNR